MENIAPEAIDGEQPQYLVDIPALPPLASERDDMPAPAIAAGDALANANLKAATQQKQLRKCYYQAGLATYDEYAASKYREQKVLAETTVHTNPVGMENRMNQMIQEMRRMSDAIQGTNQEMRRMRQEDQEEMRRMSDAIQGTNQEMRRINETIQGTNQDVRRLNQEMVRNSNRLLVRTTTDYITPIPNRAGELPPDNLFYPSCIDDVTNLNAQQLDALLQFYNIEDQVEQPINVADKQSAIGKFLGLTLYN